MNGSRKPLPWRWTAQAATWTVALLCLLLTACEETPSGLYTGYIEAETLELGVPAPGHIEQQPVLEGQQVAPGDLLFVMEQETQQAAVELAQAQLQEARSGLADMQKGARPEEIAALQANLREADAQVEFAQAEQKRLQTTASQNYSSRSDLDKAIANYKQAVAHRAALQHQLQVAQLPAREDALAVANDKVAAAQARLREAQWNLQQTRVLAPQAGTIEEIYFRPGEFVTAATPVISLLLTGQYKVRFYVAPDVHSGLQLGQTVQILSPQAGGNNLTASISLLASEPEFTPPVLYGKDSRDELVFLVEARLQHDASLTPGVPVDVRL